MGYKCKYPHQILNGRYAINPARDLGPRIMASMCGWKDKVWKDSDYYFWIPVFFCHLGGVIGAGLHLVAVEWDWGEGEDAFPEEKKDDV